MKELEFKGLNITWDYPVVKTVSGRLTFAGQPSVQIGIPEIQEEVAIVAHVVYNYNKSMEYMRDVYPQLFIKVPKFDSGIDDFNPIAYLNLKEPIRHDLFRNIIESAMIDDILEAIEEHEKKFIPERARL